MPSKGESPNLWHNDCRWRLASVRMDRVDVRSLVDPILSRVDVREGLCLERAADGGDPAFEVVDLRYHRLDLRPAVRFDPS